MISQLEMENEYLNKHTHSSSSSEYEESENASERESKPSDEEDAENDDHDDEEEIENDENDNRANEVEDYELGSGNENSYDQYLYRGVEEKDWKKKGLEKTFDGSCDDEEEEKDMSDKYIRGLLDREREIFEGSNDEFDYGARALNVEPIEINKLFQKNSNELK
jgi:hypothetical protein